MSTTFHVIPVETTKITFQQVIDASQRHINYFLSTIGISRKLELQLSRHNLQENKAVDLECNSRFFWKDHEYVWFSIEGMKGGTAAYCHKIEDAERTDDPWWRLTNLAQRNKAIYKIEEKLERAKAFDTRWSLTRYPGKPGIFALSYGLIAAAIAELTDGIIWSDDGAWDHQRFPADSEYFLQWYFRPEKAVSNNNAVWARRFIDEMREQFAE